MVLSCFLFESCKKDMPKDIIKPALMENLLYDYHMAKVMADDLPYEDRYKQPLYYNYVFRKYKVNQAQFDSSMVWYTRHIDELSKIYEKINIRYKAQQDAINHLIAIRDNKPKMSEPGDSIDIWYGNRLYKLANSIVSNKLKFKIPTDTNFKERDSLIWRMRYTFFPIKKNTQDSAVMIISIKYNNDSLAHATKQITHSGLDSIIVKSDSDYQIKEIKGIVYYFGQDNDKSLLIDQISLTRYHNAKKDTASIAHTDSLKKDSIKKIEKVKEVIPQKIEIQKEEVSPQKSKIRENSPRRRSNTLRTKEN